MAAHQEVVEDLPTSTALVENDADSKTHQEQNVEPMEKVEEELEENAESGHTTTIENDISPAGNSKFFTFFSFDLQIFALFKVAKFNSYVFFAHFEVFCFQRCKIWKKLFVELWAFFQKVQFYFQLFFPHFFFS